MLSWSLFPTVWLLAVSGLIDDKLESQLLGFGDFLAKQLAAVVLCQGAAQTADAVAGFFSVALRFAVLLLALCWRDALPAWASVLLLLGTSLWRRVCRVSARQMPSLPPTHLAASTCSWPTLAACCGALWCGWPVGARLAWRRDSCFT